MRYALFILLLSVISSARADFVFIEEESPAPSKASSEVPVPGVAGGSEVSGRGGAHPLHGDDRAAGDIHLGPSHKGSAPGSAMLTQAAPTGVAVVPSVPTHRAAFDVRAGETVRGAFERWTSQAGWTLRWQADFDIVIEADHLYASDELTEVVPEVLAAFRVSSGRKRLVGSAHRGNRVIVIEGKVQP